MTTILLIRHGDIGQSRPRRFIGQTDLPLTERGRQQMERLKGVLAGYAMDRVVCSPLGRCRESAAILCSRLDVDPEVVDELREIGLGSWEGLCVDEVRQRFPGAYEERGRSMAGFRPEGGESFLDLQHRVWPVLERIARGQDERVAIVAHAGVNRVLLCRILGMALENLFRLEQGYGCCSVIRHRRQQFSVACLNLCPEDPLPR